MIKTNTPEYASLQNMIKFYAKVLIEGVDPSLVGKKVISIDISNNRAAGLTYRSFKRWGDRLNINLSRIFKKYVEIDGLKNDSLDEYRLTSLEKFMNFFSNPFTLGLINDYIEENYQDFTLKVKFSKDTTPKFSDIMKANKYFKSSGKSITWVNPDLIGLNELMDSLENPEDINNYWVCRTMNGNAPAMLVECGSFNSDGTPNWSDLKEAHHIRSIYSAYTKTSYMDARECSYGYWDKNEDVRFSTAE